jgi:hypothetical protein
MANNQALTPVDAQKAAATARAEVDSYVALVDGMAISNAAEWELGNGLLTDIRDAEVKHEAARTEITRPMNEALRKVNALFKPLAEDLAKAKAALGGKMLVFQRAETARREAAEREAAEQRRQEQAAADARLTEAAQEVLAGTPGAEAKLEEAQAEVMMADVSLPMAPVAPRLDKGGHAARGRYVATVTDAPAFLAHVAALLRAGDQTFDGVVEIKLGKLNTLGTATSGSLKIPGVTFTRDEKIVARKSK